MQPLTMLVNPDGGWLFPGSSEFLDALGDPAPDYDAVAFAVRNLGFAKFELVDRLVAEIEFHPRHMTPRALRAIQAQLLAAKVKLFRIKYWQSGWRSEILSCAEHAVARLGELCAPAFSPARTERFRVEPADPGSLFVESPQEVTGVRLLARKWRASFCHFDLNILPLAERHQLLPLLTIVGVGAREREPVFRFIGKGHSGWAGRKFQLEGVGDKVANLPDKEYGGWAAGFYRSVAETGEPRYDLVTAAMRYQDEDGIPLRRVRYERLLLPWKTPSGEVFVTSCATVVERDGAANLASAEDNSVAR